MCHSITVTAFLTFVSVAIGQSTPPAQPSAPKPAAEPGAKSTTANVLPLDGILFKVPDGWSLDTAPPTGPMAPKAIYRLPKVEGDAEDATIRITHFASMKGKDDANIDRWIGQVKRADGKPATKDDAKITKFEQGSLRVTFVDISGTISGTMTTGTDPGKPNQRAINVIVDHPKGPHYLRAVGSAATIAKWQSSIEAFAKTATVLP